MRTPEFSTTPSGKNQRPCPAVQGFISSAECGAQRGSKLNCPADCPFYPFGTADGCYDSWLRLDENWGTKAFDYARRHFGEERFARLVRAHLADSERDKPEAHVMALSATLYRVLFIERDSGGRTLADSWEAEGWTGLHNDLRVMMKYRRHSYVTVVEVQKIRDHQSTWCVDALSPSSPPFVLIDRTSTPHLVRFTRLLAWVTHYPHFSRLGGAAQEVPIEIWPLWKEVIEHRLNRERAAQPGLTLRDLLAHDFPWAGQMVVELGTGYRQRLFAGTDFHQCVAIHKVTEDLERVKAILDASSLDRVDERPFAPPGAQ